MLIKAPQIGIFEKIVRSKNGQLLRVRFEVSEINGQLKGRVISTEAIAEFAALGGTVSATHTTKSEAIFLPVSISKTITEKTVSFAYTPVVSPFSTLLFFTSQPTRAPSK